MNQAWNHGSFHNTPVFTTCFLFLKLFFRDSQVLLVYLCGCAVIGVIDVFVSVCASFAPHLSSVAHADESAHWLESTGSTGQEVGAVVGLQEAHEVGALRLQNTDMWTSALDLSGIQEKDAFYMVVLARNNFPSHSADPFTQKYP